MSKIGYRDCIKTAAKFLERDDVASAIESGQTSFSGELKATVNMLISCTDLVLHEIACDYVPLKFCEEVKSRNGRIYFKDLTKNIIDFYCVEAESKPVQFVLFHDCILLPYDAKFTVTYSYAPVKGTLETKLEWDGERVGERVVAYGIACEFNLMSGLVEDASLWDKRFKDSLFKASIVKNERVVRRRSWY